MISSFPWESETSPRRKRARRGPKSAMTKHVSLVGEEKHGESFGMLIEPRADEFLRKHVRSSDAFAISEVDDGILCDAYSAGTSRENLDVYEKESRAFQPFTKTPTRCPVLSRYVKGALKVSLGENLDVIRRYGPAGFINAKMSACDALGSCDTIFYKISTCARFRYSTLLSFPHTLSGDVTSADRNLSLSRSRNSATNIQSWNSVRLFTRVHRNIHAYTLITLIGRNGGWIRCGWNSRSASYIYLSLKFDRGILTVHLIHVTQRPHSRLTANARDNSA